VQTLLDPDVAGVMFTEHPVTGADERLIEASWGLGEALLRVTKGERAKPLRTRDDAKSDWGGLKAVKEPRE
jgi:hypothetical protein